MTHQTIDVKELFVEVTGAYIEFNESINRLIQNLLVYTPQQINDKCSNLNSDRNNLAILDDRLFDVICLAGKEIESEQFVHDYRIAFSSALHSSDLLYEHLHVVKSALISQQNSATEIN